MVELTTTITVSLRTDELEVIDRLVKEYHLKRHEVIKLAIRVFLFPSEREHVLDGKRAILESLSIRMPVSEHQEEMKKAESLAHKKIIVYDGKELIDDLDD